MLGVKVRQKISITQYSCMSAIKEYGTKFLYRPGPILAENLCKIMLVASNVNAALIQTTPRNLSTDRLKWMQ